MLTLFTGVIALILFTLGSAIGSFLLVVADRYQKQENPFLGRSRCDYCKKNLRWYELIPCISFVLQLGRCRTCNKQLASAYPLFELFSGLLLVGSMGQAMLSGEHILVAGLSYIIMCILLILIRIDSVSMLLPDSFIALLFVASCILALLMERSMSDALLGVLSGSGFLYILWLITRGAGIGFGDVKLMIPLGILFGFQGVVTLLFLAFFVGGMIGIWLLVTKRAGAKTAIPFGPFLATASFVIMIMPSLPDRFFQLLGVQ